jgi:hypothetical protein
MAMQLRPGEKRGSKVGKTKRGKGTKWMLLVDGQGTPLGACLDSASPAEVTLLEKTLETVSVSRKHRPGRPRCNPDRLIADRGYDSNPLRKRLKARGIDPIIPARSNNAIATDQVGVSCGVIGTGGSLNARSRGWDGCGGFWCDTSV